MDGLARIERVLGQAISGAGGSACPPRLSAALRHAVFPGGARIRPRLTLAVALSIGEDDPAVVDGAAAAIELLHCASLVHDDLPCFDNAPTRRGKPSVHRAFGERLAVLAGDALIVLAFETAARGARARPERLGPLIAAIGAGVGAPTGISAGQAWECEPRVDVAQYHAAKTGALFAAATMAGAAAAGVDPAPWRALGERLGAAYQVADDLRDVTGDAAQLGKPTGVDAALGRPSVASELGVAGAVDRLKQLIAAAFAAIPDCAGAVELRGVIRLEAERLLPEELARRAA